MQENLQFLWSIMPSLLDGAKVTFSVFGYTLFGALPLGLLIALMRITKFYPLRAVASVYIWLLRGTPLLLQLYFVYFGLPYMGLTLDRFTAAVVTFILNYSAYYAEIYRAGIQSIDQGQYEASKALGMTYVQTMRRIIIPQTIRRIIPPLSNETVTLVKDTALITAIGVIELLRRAKEAVNRTVNPIAFFGAAVIYLAVTLILTVIFKKIEERYSCYELR